MFGILERNLVSGLSRLLFSTAANTSHERQLVDKFNRVHDYLRISLTERCNLRCKYCMPEHGVELTKRESCLSFDEIQRLSSLLVKSCGINKVRLTGGEPTIDSRLPSIIQHLNELRKFGLKTISMTTNGLTLAKKCDSYKSLGLDSVNISMDSLIESKYELITRRKGFKMAYKGLMSAMAVGLSSVKLNCVVIREFNLDEILNFVELAKQHPIDVRFIEFMPFEANNWSGNSMVPYKEMLDIIKLKYPQLHAVTSLDNKQVSKTYSDASMVGQIGFISSMSENFCSGCNRLRLTADGNLKVCLFGREELSLRDLMRHGATDGEIIKAIQTALYGKWKQHSGPEALLTDTSRPMVKIASNDPRIIKSNEPIDRMKARGVRAQHVHGFSHLDKQGRASMVDVGAKDTSRRVAIAEGKIFVGHELLSKIEAQSLKKGDIMSVSRVAGIMAAKKTASLIPLCHQVPLDCVQVDIRAEHGAGCLVVSATTKSRYQTGVEMESLTAVSLTLLTIYDMCKSHNKLMVIRDIRLLSKVKFADN